MIFPWSSHGHWTMNLSARNSTFALSSNGTVFAWGDNQDAAKGADGADGASLAAVVDKCGQWQSYDNHLLLSTDMNWQSLTMWQSFEFTARIVFSALKMERQYETQYFVMTVMISLWFLEVASDIKWHQVAKMTKCRWKCVTSLILRPQVEEWPTKLTLLQETRVPKIPVVFCHVLPTLRLIVSVRKHRMLWTMSESDCIWCPRGWFWFHWFSMIWLFRWFHLQVRKLEVFDGKTIVAHIRARNQDAELKEPAGGNWYQFLHIHCSILQCTSQTHRISLWSFFVTQHCPSIGVTGCRIGDQLRSLWDGAGGWRSGHWHRKILKVPLRQLRHASTASLGDLNGSTGSHLISFDLIFHHFPPSFSSTMKFDEFHVILFGLPKFGAGLAGVWCSGGEGGDRHLQRHRWNERSHDKDTGAAWRCGDGVSENFCCAISGYIGCLSHNMSQPRANLPNASVLQLFPGMVESPAEHQTWRALWATGRCWCSSHAGGKLWETMGNVGHRGTVLPKAASYAEKLDAGGVLGQTHKSRCRPPRFGSDLVRIQSELLRSAVLNLLNCPRTRKWTLRVWQSLRNPNHFVLASIVSELLLGHWK